jgi:hypothetical protein
VAKEQLFTLKRNWMRLLAAVAGCVIVAPMVGAAVPGTSMPGTAPAGTPASPGEPVTGPLFSFQDGTVRIGPGDTIGEATLTADGVDAGAMAGALEAITDVTLPQAATGISFDTGRAFELQRHASNRTWVIPVKVHDLPVNADQARFARVRVAGKEAVFAYSLSSRPATPVEYDLAMRDQWFVSPDRLTTALLVSSRDQPVSGLRIALAKLSEQSLGFPIETQALELCMQADGACSAIEVVPAHSSRTLFLRLKPELLRNGDFKGSLLIASDARPEGKAVSVEVASSSTPSRVLGALLIVVSVVIAWGVNVRGRSVVTRLSTLKLATAAHERFGQLLLRVQAFQTRTQVALEQLAAELTDRIEQSSEESLDAAGLLPLVNEFYRSFDAEAFRALLAEFERSLRALTIVVQGVDELGRLWADDTTGAVRAKIPTAAAYLDHRVRDADEAEQRVREALAAALPDTTHALAYNTTQRAARPTSSAELTARIESTNRLAWIVYLLVVSMAGITLLIVKTPGFGTSLDFVYCFFWGFGLPTALDKLQQLTPSGVGTALSMTVPK